MVKELHKEFENLEFEPKGHIYTVEGEEFMSATTSVKEFYEPFDVELQAQLYAQRHGGDPEEIARDWENNRIQAANFGTDVHEFGERFFSDRTLQPSNNHEKAVVAFWKDIKMNMIPLYPELQVYTKRLKKAGTIDLLLYDGLSNGFVIADYKTNKNLYKNFRGKTMIEPFDDLLDMPLSHYEVQLSLYQIAIQEIGHKVIDRWVIWLKPDATYELISTPDHTQRLLSYYKSKVAC